ncbi:MAG: hypothetical protein GW795_07610 [Cyanobacteria bacterium]|nr:hypothetical protein [Cyanobacteria bacterium CG_2015-16_32_12]NCO77517.1 hypothetical protein [Cyanobacteria bacterium CG_2015-22_32_23]NCQ04197.1 hypothetical protein [Cyanobacteria bacterium CG_2015-09_32_10]NCQ41746.1 hypothetical protein [Cyanobacteria bacterium CG_2015-04_32_10]NCS84209.1 hypothetical protein [Cyanobacteria bacterium CG_2015-02_32_10]
MIIDNYNTVDELANLLSIYGVDTSNWTHLQGNKTLEQLFIEIKEEEESSLEIIDHKLVRSLKVSSIIVKFKLGNNYFQLVEDKQIFFTGIERKRELSTITEKLKNNENSLQAAYRGLEEEIGLKLDSGLIFNGETRWEKISPSYPNLLSVYQLFNYSIILGEKELKSIRFSEYQESEQMLNLFTLKPCDN